MNKSHHLNKDNYDYSKNKIKEKNTLVTNKDNKDENKKEILKENIKEGSDNHLKDKNQKRFSKEESHDRKHKKYGIKINL